MVAQQSQQYQYQSITNPQSLTQRRERLGIVIQFITKENVIINPNVFENVNIIINTTTYDWTKTYDNGFLFWISQEDYELRGSAGMEVNFTINTDNYVWEVLVNYVE